MAIFAGLLAGMHLCFALVILMGRARNKKTMFWVSIALGALFVVAATSYAQLAVVGALAYVGIAAGRVFSGRWISFGTGSSSSSKNNDVIKVGVKSIFATGPAVGIAGAVAALFVSVPVLAFIVTAWAIAAGIDFCLRFSWGND